MSLFMVESGKVFNLGSYVSLNPSFLCNFYHLNEMMVEREKRSERFLLLWKNLSISSDAFKPLKMWCVFSFLTWKQTTCPWKSTLWSSNYKHSVIFWSLMFKYYFAILKRVILWKSCTSGNTGLKPDSNTSESYELYYPD